MRIAGQQGCAPQAGGREDDGIGGGKPVGAASLRRRQGNFGVQGDDLADLRERNHLICLVLTQFARQPLRQLKLHHGRHQPVGLFRHMPVQFLTGR